MLAAAVSLSILGLALGPVFFAWGRGRALPSAAFDGFTLGLVPAVVLLRLLPHVHEEVGPLSIALLAAGYGALWLVERVRHRSLGRVGEAVALPALVVHATADGATLGIVLGQGGVAPTGAASSGWLLAAALLVHRLPEGLFVARTLVPEGGWRRTLVWLGVLSLGTVAGAALGDRALAIAPHGVFHGVVAVGLGAILRLATHSHGRPPQTRGGIVTFVLALICGLALNALVPAADLREAGEHAVHDPHMATLAGSVALVLVVGLSLWRFAPRAWVTKLSPAPPCEHEHPPDSTAHIPPP